MTPKENTLILESQVAVCFRDVRKAMERLSDFLWRKLHSQHNKMTYKNKNTSYYFFHLDESDSTSVTWEPSLLAPPYNLTTALYREPLGSRDWPEKGQ